jgi:hypothetical protein
MAARNMYRIEINIHEKRIVRQVDYLQRFFLTITSNPARRHAPPLTKSVLEALCSE